jgi:hypothetical protein
LKYKDTYFLKRRIIPSSSFYVVYANHKKFNAQLLSRIELIVTPLALVDLDNNKNIIDKNRDYHFTESQYNLFDLIHFVTIEFFIFLIHNKVNDSKKRC